MGTYIAKRVLQFIPVFLGVTIILFVLQNVVPGDPIRMITGGRDVPEQTEELMRINNHLIQVDENGNALRDENGDYIPTSLVDRYLHYMGNLLQGDLGTSYQKKVSVTSIFAEKYPYTVKLALCAIALEAVMGIGAGVLSAIKRYSFWDIIVTLFTSVMVAIPAFWLGMLLQWFFGILMKEWTGGAFSMPISGAGGAGLAVPGLDALHLARLHARGRVDRVHGAHHALPAPGCHEPGLHSHCEGQGPLEAFHHHPPCAQERADSGHHLYWHRLRSHARWSDSHRNGLQLAGCWI